MEEFVTRYKESEKLLGIIQLDDIFSFPDENCYIMLDKMRARECAGICLKIYVRSLFGAASNKNCHQIYRFMEINDQIAEIAIFHPST